MATLRTKLDNVDNEHPDYIEMCEHWKLPDALIGGTAAMRSAGAVYLPKEAKESQAAYNARRNRSFLYNAFGSAMMSLRGKVLSEPLRLVDATPKQEEWVTDIDRSGRDLTQFSFPVFEDMIRRGHTHIFVDYPETLQTTNFGEELALRARPYFVHVPADALFAWYDDGDGTLTQVRWKESELRQSGQWSWERVERIRVLTQDSFAIYERTFDASDDPVLKRTNQISRKEYKLIEEKSHTLGRIPLVTLYAERSGHMTSTVPLQALAEKNLEHWQSASDQRNILHAARVPFWFAEGMTEAEAKMMSFGPYFLVYGPKGSSLDAKEFEGSAIGAGRQDLVDLKEEMAILAMEPTVRNVAGETARRVIVDSAKGHSSLKAWALNYKDGVENAFRIAGEWADEEVDPVIEIDTTFGISEENEDKARIIMEARKARDISRREFWREMIALGIVSEEFDQKANEIALVDEAEEAMERFGLQEGAESDDDEEEEDGDSSSGGNPAFGEAA